MKTTMTTLAVFVVLVFVLSCGSAAHAVTLLPGDADNNELVSGSDFVATQSNFGAIAVPPDGLLWGDANDDGLVNGADFVTTQVNFGNFVPASASASASAAPEPSTVGLLLVGLLGLVAYGSRKRR